MSDHTFKYVDSAKCVQPDAGSTALGAYYVIQPRSMQPFISLTSQHSKNCKKVNKIASNMLAILTLRRRLQKVAT